jgi:hypothetical protein
MVAGACVDAKMFGHGLCRTWDVCKDRGAGYLQLRIWIERRRLREETRSN